MVVDTGENCPNIEAAKHRYGQTLKKIFTDLTGLYVHAYACEGICGNVLYIKLATFCTIYASAKNSRQIASFLGHTSGLTSVCCPYIC